MPPADAAPRLATPEDNRAAIELLGAVPMSGELILSTRREPDFFALYDLQRATTECWVLDGQGGQLDGLGTVVIRDGWVRGQPAKVGYLGDLRARIGAGRRGGVARFYGQIFDEARRRHGCELFLTSVLASNAAALNALVHRKRKARGDQPTYHLLRRFSACSIQLAGRRRVKPGPWTVRTATPADLPAIEARLDEDHRARPFGYRFDQGELRHRLERWPGFSLARTYLAHDAQGRLVACATAWEPASVKRFRVEAYRGRMRWARLGYNALAALRGFPPLPRPGEEFRYFYLCNVSVAGDDPAVFRALLEAVYADSLAGGHHFFTFYREEGDPLAAALRGFWIRSLDFNLYLVTRDPAGADVGPGRTGFEISLA